MFLSNTSRLSSFKITNNRKIKKRKIKKMKKKKRKIERGRIECYIFVYGGMADFINPTRCVYSKNELQSQPITFRCRHSDIYRYFSLPVFSVSLSISPFLSFLSLLLMTPPSFYFIFNQSISSCSELWKKSNHSEEVLK